MATHPTDYTTVAIAVTGMLGAFLLAFPGATISAGQSEPTQVSPSTSTTSPTPPAAQPTRVRPTRVDRVEARITSLHAQLKITGAQESQWSAFAQVMKDNAKAIDALIQSRAQEAKAMTAVDDLRAYQGIADAHAEGLKKLIPAFEAVYASMSDAQKKNADAVFGRMRRR
jgi:LTXXQ motif family protein